MDLALHGALLWRYRHLAVVGTLLAVVLAALTYARPTLDGVVPTLEPRASEVWQSSSTFLLTRSGFPEGQVSPGVDPNRFYQLADVYAQVATSDAVLAMLRRSGGVPGTVTAFNPPSSTSGPSPVVTLQTTAPTADGAAGFAERATEAFTLYLAQRQRAAGIPKADRVVVRVLRNSDSPVLIQPRKKTFAIVVFLAVISATFALIYVLDNASRRRDAKRLTAVPTADGTLAAEGEFERRAEGGLVVEPELTRRADAGGRVLEPERGRAADTGERVVEPERGPRAEPGEQVVEPERGRTAEPEPVSEPPARRWA